MKPYPSQLVWDKEEIMSSGNNELDPNCNEFFIGNDNMPIIYLNYGYYIKWGRPRHYVNRLRFVIKELVTLGYSVQLKHDEEGEDYISLNVNNIQICYSKDIQNGYCIDNLKTSSISLVKEFHQLMSVNVKN